MLVLLILTWSKPAIGTGFVSPDDLPQSDEEDEEQAVFASVKLQSKFLTSCHPIHIQVIHTSYIIHIIHSSYISFFTVSFDRVFVLLLCHAFNRV